MGETYLVSAWGNEHLYSSAVVDGDRAYYRRAVDEATHAEVFLDPEDRCLEARPDGTLVPGRLALSAGKPGLVRFPSRDEISFQRVAAGEETPVLVPVYLDPSGRRIAPLPAPAEPPVPETCTASRSDLRRGMERVRTADTSPRGAK